MEKIPKEIFLVIFSYLSFKTKLQCLLVSKDWHSWILRHSLFNELECQSPASLSKAITYFQENLTLGKSVYKLCIKNCYNLKYNLTALPNLFPNVKEFELDEARDEIITLTTAPSIVDILNWRNIQKINSTECFEDGVFLIGNILKSPCSYLTCIDILFDVDYHQSTMHRIPYVKKKSELLGNIKNAPYLQSLSLDCLHLSIDDLEQLHQFTPNLKSLVLKNITLIPQKEELHSVKSVPLQMLHIQFRYLNDTLLPWLSYTTLKYTHLESFQFECTDSSFFPNNSYEEKVLQLIANNPKLKHYGVCLCPFSDPIVNELDKNDISLDTIAIYSTEQNTLENQCDALLLSNQKNLIKSITIHFTTQNTPDARSLNLFQHLNHIELSSKSQSVPVHLLSQFLQDLPYLDSISLDCSHIACGPLMMKDSPSFTAHIKHISIGQLKIGNYEDLKAINYFFRSLFPKCPQLETFSLCFKFPILEEPLEEELFIEFEKDNPHLFDYLDLHLILDLENLHHLKSVHLSSNSHWYQFLRPNMKVSTIPSYYYLHDPRIGEFKKKYNILPRYFFTTLFLNKKIFVNSIKV